MTTDRFHFWNIERPGLEMTDSYYDVDIEEAPEERDDPLDPRHW
jgi:hypothetical protein